jgi:hypothetical protein
LATADKTKNLREILLRAIMLRARFTELKQMAKAPVDLRSLARSHASNVITILAGIARQSPSDGARVAACGILLERGYGKAPQTFGEDGEGAIQVIIRHIVESVPAPGARTIDHAPLANGNGDTSADDNDRDA